MPLVKVAVDAAKRSDVEALDAGLELLRRLDAAATVEQTETGASHGVTTEEGPT